MASEGADGEVGAFSVELNSDGGVADRGGDDAGVVSKCDGGEEEKKVMEAEAKVEDKEEVVVQEKEKEKEAEAGVDENLEHGFGRKEMYGKPLVGSVQLYERHLFLGYQGPESWPSQVEASEFDRLPRSFASALKARREDMPRKTRMTVCEGKEGSDVVNGDVENGDVLIFPDMLRYNGLTHSDVDAFVDEVLVHGRDWKQVPGEKMSGSHVFVCAHGSKDVRCGYCGPPLIRRFEEEIRKAGMVGKVFVRACSHIGGHKFAGNVIIFRPGDDGLAQGHWFGYVTPQDVPALLEEHVVKGEVVERLWRGQMGMGVDDQKESQKKRLELRGECACAKAALENGLHPAFSCNKGEGVAAKTVVEEVHPEKVPSSSTPICDKLPSWIRSWKRPDTVTALSVLGVVSTVAVAYYVLRARSKARGAQA